MLAARSNTGCSEIMHPPSGQTFRNDTAKLKVPACREFNSASDGVCFVKQFVAVLVLQHQKENQVQSFTLTNLDRVNHEFELIATYPTRYPTRYSKVFRAIANKFSSLRTMIFGLRKLATIIHSLNLPETVKTRIWNSKFMKNESKRFLAPVVLRKLD